MDLDQLKEYWEILLAILGFCITVYFRAGRMIRSNRFWSKLSFTGVLFYSGIILAVTGLIYGGSRMYRNWYYELGPVPYDTIEAAAQDGCVVIQPLGGIMDGEENWEQFLRYERKGVAAIVRIAVHDGGTVNTVNELLYDGQQYHYTRNTRYIHQKAKTDTYPSLLNLVYQPTPEEEKNYTRREFWMLTEDTSMTAAEADSFLYAADERYASHCLICETDWIPENKIFSPEMFPQG